MSNVNRSRILEIIYEEVPYLKLQEIDPNAPLSEKMDMDSVQIVGVISKIEEMLNIEIPLSILEVKTLNQFLAVIEKQL
jgi:acyl carrier protein